MMESRRNFLRQKLYSVATDRVPISKHETRYTSLKRCFFFVDGTQPRKLSGFYSGRSYSAKYVSFMKICSRSEKKKRDLSPDSHVVHTAVHNGPGVQTKMIQD